MVLGHWIAELVTPHSTGIHLVLGFPGIVHKPFPEICYISGTKPTKGEVFQGASSKDGTFFRAST